MRIELPAIATRDEVAAKTLELVQNLHAAYGSPRTDAPLRAVETKAPYGAAYGSDRPSDAAFRLLEVTSEDWFRTLTQVYKTAGFRPDDGELLCAELMSAGYVTIHPVKTFRPGGQIKLMLPTQTGLEKLRAARARIAPIRGDAPHGTEGDASHIFYQNIICKKLRKQGWTAEIEMTLKAKRVDVGAARAKVMRAYEVVNEGLEKEISNLTQDVEDGWSPVVFCVGNEQIKQELMERIEAQLGVRSLEACEFAYLPSFR